MTIHQSIAKIMQEAGAISKERKNNQQGYKFRGIDDVYNEFNPHLAANGVFFCPNVIDMKREERQTKTGNNLIYTVLTVQYDVYASDGTSVRLVTIGEAMDSGDKSANKAMSAALKYAMFQLFCIPTEDEKDTETQTHEVISKQAMATNAPVGQSTSICKKCGALEAISKTTGKPYCSAKCWLTPVQPQRTAEDIAREFSQSASNPDGRQEDVPF